MAELHRITLGRIIWIEGDANPNGVVSAPKGSCFVDKENVKLYTNQNGATLWSEVTGYQNLKSITFNGTSQYLNIGDVSSARFERTDTFTLSVWFKTTTIGGPMQLISKREQQTGSPYYYRGYGIVLVDNLTPDEFRIDLCNNTSPVNNIGISYQTSDGIFTDGNWHHLAMTYDGSSQASGVQFYLDGAVQTGVVTENNLTGTIQTSSPLLFGARGDPSVNVAKYWNGGLDEGSIWNKNLSQAEITEIYSAGTPTSLTNHSAAAYLVGWWKMGDGDSYPTITDSSVNNNSATMVNMSTANIVSDTP